MAGEPGMPCCMLFMPMTSKLLNSFVTQGDKEEMVTRTTEEPVSLSRSALAFLGVALLA